MMMFDLFDVIFPVVFLTITGIAIYGFVSGIKTWSKNNQSPRLTVDATVVAKREDVTHHHHANAGDMTGAHGFSNTMSTTYYVTFEVESGDRMELSVSGREFGMMAEGDIGRLHFQGTRFLDFERR